MRQSTLVQVDVTIEFNTEHVRLCFRDDGCGFDAHSLARSKEGHFGLVGIQERARTIGAELSISSQPGAGTEVTVTIPKHSTENVAASLEVS